MNVNVKLSLTDDQRRALASSIAGKPVKRLATRADVNELVNQLLATTMAGKPLGAAHVAQVPSEPVVAGVMHDNHLPYCSDQCCRQNELLQSRVNVLQHKLDTLK